MSWGERSCVRPCRRPEQCTIGTCNVDCPDYKWDGYMKPDSEPRMQNNQILVTNRNKKENVGQFKKMNQSGRNELCPCGSGLKAKKCCLKRKALRDQISIMAARDPGFREHLAAELFNRKQAVKAATQGAV